MFVLDLAMLTGRTEGESCSTVTGDILAEYLHHILRF